MFRKYFYYLKKSDWLLSLVVIFLVVFGLIAIYSIESAAEDPTFLNFKKQLIFFGLGLGLLIFFSLLDYRYLKTYAWVLYGLGLLTMLALLVFGTTIRGTKGWLFLFGEQGFQPVEMVKILLIIMVSKCFYDWRGEIGSVKNLAIIFAVVVPLIALVVLQPDVGSSLVLATIFLGLLFLVKTNRAYLIGVVVLLIAVAAMSWFLLLKDYQKERILTFLDPSRDPWGSGYNIKQSTVAVGSGNLFGRGLGLGSQSRLNFLPAQETDFIFAVIAEELGFIGSSLLLIFFVVFVYRLIKIARAVRDDFGLFLLCGLVIYFTAQSVMNVGMNVGMVPIAGVPLPFVSYGGSSLITGFIAIGIAQSVYIRQAEKLT